MTFPELMKIFREARNEANKAGVIYEGAMDAAGIRAVVEALRGQMGFWWTGCDCCDRNSDVFDEILASDGVEAAGSE
jgi:hypothetical protein